MKDPSRALLIGGVAAAAVLAAAGGFLFFSNVPAPGAASEQVVAEVPQMKQADIDRIIAERKTRAPRPSAIASVEERIGTSELKAENQFSALPMDRETFSVAEGNQGDEMFAAGRFGEALAFWATQAEAGDRWSAYRLGSEYLKGDPAVVARNIELGVRWIRVAAIKNEPHAQYVFGRLHETGDGVEVDSAQAASWFLKAAQRGNREAQFAIAPRLRDGNGLERDTVEALKFYILASRHRAAADSEDEASAVASSAVAVAPPETALRAAMPAAEVREAERRAAAFTPIQD